MLYYLLSIGRKTRRIHLRIVHKNSLPPARGRSSLEPDNSVFPSSARRTRQVRRSNNRRSQTASRTCLRAYARTPLTSSARLRWTRTEQLTRQHCTLPLRKNIHMNQYGEFVFIMYTYMYI